MLLHEVVRALHLLSLMLWVGSLVSITRVLSGAQGESDAVRPRLADAARRIYRTVASVWMGIATLTGIALIAIDGAALFHAGWFHGKLAAALALLAVHFVLGARVKSAQSQGLTDEVAAGARTLQLGVLLLATLSVAFVVVLKAFRAGH